jgi:hypothetical protein
MIEEVFEHTSPKTIAIAAVAIFAVVKVAQFINNEFKIRRLGSHAPKVRSWLPLSKAYSSPLLFSLLIGADVDLIFLAIQNTMQHQNLSGWRAWFGAHGPTPIWTVESAPAGRRVVFTADPENIKAILATQFTDYGKGEPFHKEWSDFLGDSIFVTDLDTWHNSRQLIRPQFIKDRVSDLGIFEEHVQILMRRISEEGTKDGRQGGALDVSDLFFRYTLDAATHFLLGRSVGSLEVPEQEFAEAFAEAQRVQNIIARAG